MYAALFQSLKHDSSLYTRSYRLDIMQLKVSFNAVKQEPSSSLVFPQL